MSGILVFERTGRGHEQRYLEIIAKVLEATPLMSRTAAARRRLMFWPGPLVCSTANAYFKSFMLIAFVRFLMGRRTVAIFIRDPRLHRPALMRAGWQRALFNLAIGLPTVRCLSIFAPAPQWPARFEWLYDLEWWDLSVAPLPDVPVVLPAALGTRTVVFLGKAIERKGLSFFLAAAAARHPNLQFVIVGDTAAIGEADKAAFAAAGGKICARAEDDAQFVSYIRKADWVWCCYSPDWHASSGIFGRALQLGRRSVVREGSYLAEFQRRHGSGAAVPYGDIARLLETLSGPMPAPRPLPPTGAFADHSIRRLRSACGLPAGDAAESAP